MEPALEMLPLPPPPAPAPIVAPPGPTAVNAELDSPLPPLARNAAILYAVPSDGGSRLMLPRKQNVSRATKRSSSWLPLSAVWSALVVVPFNDADCLLVAVPCGYCSAASSVGAPRVISQNKPVCRQVKSVSQTRYRVRVRKRVRGIRTIEDINIVQETLIIVLKVHDPRVECQELCSRVARTITQ